MTSLALLVLGGCTGEAGIYDKSGTPGSDASVLPPGVDAATSGDPWAPCTDLKSCCTTQDMVCKGDPDGNTICKCSKLWECPTPKKCHQDKQVPPGGGGTWTCTWSETGYTCEGNPSTPPGGGGWSCKYDSKKKVWSCTKSSPPNPSNKPGGTSVWKCKVDNASNKILCERDDNPPPPKQDAGVKLDKGVKPDTAPPPPPPPKKETNCGDGVDNDGDGKVDCKDEDCPACKPKTCPPGVECCDGKDNDGDGKIDEGNVCAGVGEPCPPGAFQACDCYCGVHRKCLTNGTWGPCKVDGNGTCAMAKVTSQSQCPWGTYCDYGKCVIGFIISGQCKKHTDCPTGKVCDLGKCIWDNYKPCP